MLTPMATSLPSHCSPVTIAAPSPLVGIADVSVDASIRLRTNLSSDHHADGLAASKMRACLEGMACSGEAIEHSRRAMSTDRNHDDMSVLSSATTNVSSSLVIARAVPRYADQHVERRETMDEAVQDADAVSELVSRLAATADTTRARAASTGHISWPAWQPDEGAYAQSGFGAHGQCPLFSAMPHESGIVSFGAALFVVAHLHAVHARLRSST